MRNANQYWKDERGSGAAEFALVVVPFLGLIFAIIGVSMMLYANHTLQYATEAAARCASVSSTTTCNSPAAITNYALARYSGPNITPVFAASTPACGKRVTGTGSFQLTTGLVNVAVPLSASACFPAIQ